ncbi:unnamed protein product [Brassica oleracea]
MHGGSRCSKPNQLFFVFPLEELKEKRPGVTFVADFRSPSSSSSFFFIHGRHIIHHHQG